jgi:hypothetical protein
MELKISEELAVENQEEAKARGKTVEEFLKTVMQREKTIKERKKIEDEQEWWLSLPLSERVKYEGEFIAIHQLMVIDHDKNEAKLYARVRETHGNTPILIMPAEGPREITIFSPRISGQ